MYISMIREDESLDSVWDEVVFMEARLNGEPVVKDMAPVASTMVGRVEDARKGQLAARRNEVLAQAAVSAADDALDDFIGVFDRALLDAERGNRQAPRYKRYFSNAPSTFVRMGLESETNRVRGWVASLESEPEQSLKDLATRLATLIKQGDDVLEQRRKAASARSDHRVRVILPLIEDINAFRGSLFGTLTEKARLARLPLNWPSRFFRRTARTAKVEQGGEAATASVPTAPQ